MLNRVLWTGAFILVAACASDDKSFSSPPPINTGPATLPPAQNPSVPTSKTDPETATDIPVPRTAGFVLTESDAFSTFAADVDSASYDSLRRSLQLGVLPSSFEVRAEEYINYFAYDYPAPDLESDVPFSISLSASAHIDETRPTKLLRVGIQAAKPDEIPPANLVFLVDVSGSMAAANKLPLVQDVLREILDELHSSDTVSIVSYAADTRVRLSPTPVRDRGKILNVIDALAAGGGTNGASGIQLAYGEAQMGFIDEGINHVILCTDGDFNLGITSPDALVSLIEQKRRSGVTLTALGFGDRNNDAMMERVSNAGNGIYSVLYNQDQAIAYAHERLLATTFHVAKDLKIQVEFNPSRVYAYRLIGYEDRAVADNQFRNDAVDGGEVGAGHRVTALYELALTPDDVPEGVQGASFGERVARTLEPEVREDELVRVKVRWKKPGATSGDAANEVATALGEDEIESDPERVDEDARWAIGVARLAEVLKASSFADRRELPIVRRLLAPLVGEDPDRRELVSLLPRVESLVNGRR
jgi:Ca-activated chloride channel family protein